MKNSKLLKVTLTAAAALMFAGYAQGTAKADTQSDIDAVTQQIKATQKKIKDGQVKLSKLESVQYEKSKEIDTLKKNIKARQSQIEQQARAAQANNAGSMIEFVTASKNLSEAISRTVTVATLVHANNQAVAEQKADKEKVVAAKAAVDKAANEQAKENKSLQTDQAQLEVKKVQLVAVKAKEDQAKKEAAAKLEAAREAAAKVAAAKTAVAAQKAVEDTTKIAASATSSSSSAASTTTTKVASSANYSSVVSLATSFVGVPYVWGGTSPSGFDCSGLVQYVYAKFGKSLPRTSQEQQAACTTISRSQLQPGDLCFWGYPAYHVAIYIGNGQYVHAPDRRQTVKIQSLSSYAPTSFGRVN
ncbi:Cell wall-associated hydrolase, NlpC family [Ligilactobacillus sp. WC1T17]|uniref:Cell wall-associated hydrolase, NlpC family n=1 Tax=Ligilactobacillus ruminis TaxID=1623 RepID=A0ABY1AD06_9LACO|nr:Cell wall-associated hydrolase, NlpC family [Ligilactobacillus ruminis]